MVSELRFVNVNKQGHVRVVKNPEVLLVGRYLQMLGRLLVRVLIGES